MVLNNKVSTPLILHNTQKYLSEEIVNKCFTHGSINHVDKQVCGNGFTTAFLQVQPPKGKLNILIAPNKAVVIDKQDAASNNRIKFFYQDSLDTDFLNADILVFVADSFLLYQKKIKEVVDKVDKVLIDEYHSVEIQSIFRNVLKSFAKKVDNICTNEATAITTVTASPNKFSNVDIVIYNQLKRDYDIRVTKDKKDALERIKLDIKNNENVIVFTNDRNVINGIKNYKGEISARFRVGESLFRNITEMSTLLQDEESKLTVVSSAGFEGFDIHYKNAKIYYFEDRSKKHESFYISNLYQAINRNRIDIKYIEYCRLELSNKRSVPFVDIDRAVDRFVNSGMSKEHMQRFSNRKYFPFVIFNQSEDGAFSVTKNEVGIQLFKEKLLFDQSDWYNYFNEFIFDRNIEINEVGSVNNRIINKMQLETKKKNLLSNKELIKKLDLYGSSFHLKGVDYHEKGFAINLDIRLKYLRQLENYVIKKRVLNDFIRSHGERVAFDILSDENKLSELVNKVVKEYNDRADEKCNINDENEVKDKKKKKEEFKTKAINIVCQLVILFANDRIYLPKKTVANRDYNLSTEISLSSLNIIADAFGLNVLEVDIVSCNPRILYALCGLELPSNFYGENKKNKKAINILLNSFRYDKARLTDKKRQKHKALSKFRKYGFDEKVIEYLMNNFFEAEFKGDLFNRLAFHEKNIIEEIDEEGNEYNIGTVRRHDSLLVFNNHQDLSYLNDFSYKGVKGGWFNIAKSDTIINEEFKPIVKTKREEVQGVFLL